MLNIVHYGCQPAQRDTRRQEAVHIKPVSANTTYHFHTMVAVALLFFSTVAHAGLVEDLRAVLESREASVSSLQASYVLSQRGRDPEEGTNWDGWEGLLRVRGGDTHLICTRPNGDGFIRRHEMVLSGIHKTYTVTEKGPSSGKIWQEPTPVDAPLQGDQVTIDPAMAILGIVHEESVTSRFARGAFTARTMDDGLRRLTWWGLPETNGNRVDYYLDPHDRLVRIDYGLSTTPKWMPEISDLLQTYGDDTFFRISWSLEMEDFATVDDVPVPGGTRRTYWQLDKAGRTAFLERLYQKGELKRPAKRPEAAWRRRWQDIEHKLSGTPIHGLTPLELQRYFRVYRYYGAERTAASVLTMRIDPNAVAINPNLSDDDMDVVVPEGTRIVGEPDLWPR